MFDSLEHEIKRQNKLLQQILDKGGLGAVIESIEPVRPDKAYMISTIDPYNYDKAKRQVSFNIGDRVTKIINLHREIKYFSQFMKNQYKSFKELKDLAGGADLREDIEDFIKKYEEEYKK